MVDLRIGKFTWFSSELRCKDVNVTVLERYRSSFPSAHSVA